MYIHVSQELMYGILPNLHRYHRERTMSSLCLMGCTAFSRWQQVIIQLAIIKWVGWWGDICFLWKHCYIFFYWICVKLAGNEDSHKISNEFDFGPDQTFHFGVARLERRKISNKLIIEKMMSEGKRLDFWSLAKWKAVKMQFLLSSWKAVFTFKKQYLPNLHKQFYYQ